MKMCKDFICVECVSRDCPISNGMVNREEGCQVCWFYHGCENCCLEIECNKERKENIVNFFPQ